MQAYDFPVKTMTESQCVAELFKLYQELTRRTRMGSQPRPLVSDNIPGRNAIGIYPSPASLLPWRKNMFFLHSPSSRLSAGHFVDNRSHITGIKALSCEIIPQKAGFLSFYLYLCQVIDDLERNLFTNRKLYERRFWESTPIALEPHPHLLPGMTAFVTIEFR